MLVIKTVLFLLSIFVSCNLHINILVKLTNQFLQPNITIYTISLILSLVPQVILTYYHIEVDPDNPHNAVVIFRAQVSGLYSN